MAKGRVVRANKSQTVDLEYEWFKIEKGKTYLDDDTPIFDGVSQIVCGDMNLIP